MQKGFDEFMGGRTLQAAALSAVLAGITMTGTLLAQTHKEYRFNVGPRAGLSVNNPYGSVPGRPATGNFIGSTAVLPPDRWEPKKPLAANRFGVVSHPP